MSKITVIVLFLVLIFVFFLIDVVVAKYWYLSQIKKYKGDLDLEKDKCCSHCKHFDNIRARCDYCGFIDNDKKSLCDRFKFAVSSLRILSEYYRSSFVSDNCRSKNRFHHKD